MRKYILSLVFLLLHARHALLAQPVKYASEMRMYSPKALGDLPLTYYYDYKEAFAAGKKEHKPVMVYFTGIACVNCRKMEVAVWAKKGVATRLKDDFIVALLYCDARNIKLPANEQVYSKMFKRKLESLGDKNADLQVTKFGSNSQPSYYFVNGDGKKLLKEGYYYDTDANKFMTLLDKVNANYKKTHQ